mgnify:CR=1 FL=1
MNKILLQEGLQFYRMIPKNNLTKYYTMPYHSGGSKKMSKMMMSKLSDKEYYAEHSKHHSTKHIKAMKELQKLGVDREKAHNFVKKNIGK